MTKLYKPDFERCCFHVVLKDDARDGIKTGVCWGKPGLLLSKFLTLAYGDRKVTAFLTEKEGKIKFWPTIAAGPGAFLTQNLMDKHQLWSNKKKTWQIIRPTPPWEHFSFLIKWLQITSEVELLPRGLSTVPKRQLRERWMQSSPLFTALRCSFDGGIPHMRTSISCHLMVG